jgi:hypothetical protein
MRIFVLSVLLVLVGCSLKRSPILKEERNLIMGEWRNIEDENWRFHFENSYFLELYFGHSTDSVLYEIEKKPNCNDGYIHSEFESGSLTFLNTYNHQRKDSLCYEIMGLDSINLSLRETSKGRLFVFKKVSQ